MQKIVCARKERESIYKSILAHVMPVYHYDMMGKKEYFNAIYNTSFYKYVNIKCTTIDLQ